MLDKELLQAMPKFGFGMMRLPRKDRDKDIIDDALTAQMVDRFLSAGMRYFDSAYVYNGSEEATRRALVERHPRDSFFITSKLNVNAAGVHDEASAKAELAESMRREGVDQIDFYLLHAMSSDNMQKFEDWHLWDFVRQMKEEGKIWHYGFSFHDKPQVLDDILTRHPDAEFVQLQINYADWNSPSVQSRGCYEVARKHNKPIVVMEPVKGGTLARPPKPVEEILKAADPQASCASWALRFVASLPGVMVVLSGMSDMEQMEDNLSFMGKNFRPLSEGEQETIRKAQEALSQIDQIPCTACHYCTPGCPKKILIPDLFSAMNDKLIYDNLEKAKQNYAWNVGDGYGKASDCVKCGQCEKQCPQHLPIRKLLEEVAQALE